MRKNSMPVMWPVPIRTKGRPFYIRAWRWIFSSRKWEIAENWYFVLPTGHTIIIPKGFIFDGASIPRWLWWLLSPTGILFIPGLLHDYGYRYRYLWMMAQDGSGRPFKFGKKFGQGQWDSLFKDVSAHVNGMSVVSWSAWGMLRLFGRAAWKANRGLCAPEILVEGN